MRLVVAFRGPRLRSWLVIGGIGTGVGISSVGVSIGVVGDMVDV
jgi:hypothetical protein